MKKDPVLEFLRDHQPNHLSGEEISRKLGVSRSAVWKEIQNLRHLGYQIEAQPHLGYRLLEIPDKMFADEIAYKLKTKYLGKTILSYDSLDSTNDAVFRLGEQGSKEGLCIFTEHQKKGRGRLGRSWVSPKGKGVLFSILLRPCLAPAEISRITLAIGVSIVKTVQKTLGVTLGIKWPNDVVHRDKKVAGILTEMSAESDRINFIVVGIGINANANAGELPPGSVSLKEISGKTIHRVSFAQTLLEEIESDYTHVKKGLFEELSKQWEEFSATTGRRVTAALLGRKIHGQATGIDRDGALWIRKDNGLQERITSGDIQHLR